MKGEAKGKEEIRERRRWLKSGGTLLKSSFIKIITYTHPWILWLQCVLRKEARNSDKEKVANSENHPKIGIRFFHMSNGFMLYIRLYTYYFYKHTQNSVQIPLNNDGRFHRPLPVVRRVAVISSIRYFSSLPSNRLCPCKEETQRAILIIGKFRIRLRPSCT